MPLASKQNIKEQRGYKIQEQFLALYFWIVPRYTLLGSELFPELSSVPVLERSLGRNGIMSSYNESAHIGTVWDPSTVAFSGRDAANGLRKYSSLRECLWVISVEAHAAIVGWQI